MRIGLIADIHGNLVALDIVLAELDRDGVEQTLCLGDMAVLGPKPGEVIDRLRERGIQSVCGNTDAWIVEGHPIPAAPPDSSQTIDLTNWTALQLRYEHIEYLRALPLTISVPVNGDEALLCFHATPESLDDITHAGNPLGVGERFGHCLMCCGHTHVQAVWRVDQQIWLNPGSVGLAGIGPGTPGLARNRDVYWAEYAIIDVSGQRTELTLRRVPLDLDRMWQAVCATDMPHQDWWSWLWAR